MCVGGWVGGGGACVGACVREGESWSWVWVHACVCERERERVGVGLSPTLVTKKIHILI